MSLIPLAETAWYTRTPMLPNRRSFNGRQRVCCRQLEELRKSNMTMEEELARRAAAAESGAQLVADQHRFSEEKNKVAGLSHDRIICFTEKQSAVRISRLNYFSA